MSTFCIPHSPEKKTQDWSAWQFSFVANKEKKKWTRNPSESRHSSADTLKHETEKYSFPAGRQKKKKRETFLGLHRQERFLYEEKFNYPREYLWYWSSCFSNPGIDSLFAGRQLKQSRSPSNCQLTMRSGDYISLLGFVTTHTHSS